MRKSYLVREKLSREKKLSCEKKVSREIEILKTRYPGSVVPLAMFFFDHVTKNTDFTSF